MSYMTAGEVCHKPQYDSVNVEWNINSRDLFPWRHGIYIQEKKPYQLQSPKFSFANTPAYLRIYQTEVHEITRTRFIRLCVLILDNNISKNVTFALGVKADGRVIISLSRKDVCLESGGHFMWSNLPEKTFDQQGTCTVFCELKLLKGKDASTQTNLDCTPTLCLDFQNLMQNGRNSDVMIEVQDRAFPAHKLILESRSPVFAAMFQHNMIENNTGIVKIPDNEPETIQAFLEYVYTGKVKNLSRKNSINLYSTADNYLMEELKELCLEFINQDLCVDTACDVLVMADRYCIVELKRSAEKIIRNNMNIILPTDAWKSLMEEKSSLAVEFLINVFPDDK